MIYLIGGPPRCGKTTLARHVSRRIGISYLSVDSLESVVYHYLSPAERAARLPELPGGYDARYATNTIDTIIQLYRTRARTLWPALQVLSHFALAQEQDPRIPDLIFGLILVQFFFGAAEYRLICHPFGAWACDGQELSTPICDGRDRCIDCVARVFIKALWTFARKYAASAAVLTT